jgi:hydroxyethylthiazole kinase
MRAPPSDLPQITAEILARIGERRPRVHCITNAVAQTLTPNLLLAVGAVPSMTASLDEIGEFVARADALLVNLGTLEPQRRRVIKIAVKQANERGIKWVLDPVFIDRSRPRAELAKQLIDFHPAAVRLNRAEFMGLAGTDPESGALARYALDHLTVIGLTGAIDLVGDGRRLAAIENGHPLMQKVSALGCAGSALVAACLAVETDAWIAVAAGLLALGVAGEIAAKRARGPGSFAVEILDALASLDRKVLIERGRVA